MVKSVEPEYIIPPIVITANNVYDYFPSGKQY